MCEILRADYVYIRTVHDMFVLHLTTFLGVQARANEAPEVGELEDQPRRRLPRIGAQLTAWKGCAGSFAADRLVNPSTVPREYRRRASRILTACMVRKCMRAKNREEWEALNDGVRKGAEREEMATYTDLMAGLKEARFVNDLIAVENFVLHVDPTCAFAKYIQAMASIGELDNESDDVTVKDQIKEAMYLQPEPMSLAHMQMLMASCVARADSDELDFRRDGVTVRVRGQGLGYPQVHAYWCAIARVHAVLGIPHLSPTKAAEAKERIKQLREQHRTEHCAALDLYEDLPNIREAIFKMDNKPWSKNLAKQHHHWALFLYLLEHAHRSICLYVCVCARAHAHSN